MGSASRFDKRWRNHLHLLNRGSHHSKALQNAWNKYGADGMVFEVVLRCPVDELLVKEQEFIDRIRPKYNMCPAAGSVLGIKRSAETRKKMSEALSNKSPETIAKMIAAHTGKKASSETRARLSAAHRGNTHSPETRARMSASALGKPKSRESIEKMVATRARKRLERMSA